MRSNEVIAVNSIFRASHPRVSDLIEHVTGSGEFIYEDHKSLCVGMFLGLNDWQGVWKLQRSLPFW